MENKNKDKRNFLFMLLFLFLVLLSSISIYYAVNRKESKVYGTTFATPEEANLETQKLLNDVSIRINKGIESTDRLQKFEETKNKIFK